MATPNLQPVFSNVLIDPITGLPIDLSSQEFDPALLGIPGIEPAVSEDQPVSTPQIAGADQVAGAGPRFGLTGLEIAGTAASGAGGLISGIGGLFKKKKTTPGLFAQMRSTLPARARVPMSPDQLRAFQTLGQSLTRRQSELQRGINPLQQFAQNVRAQAARFPATGGV